MRTNRASLIVLILCLTAPVDGEPLLTGDKFGPVHVGEAIAFSFDHRHRQESFRIVIMGPDGENPRWWGDREGSVSSHDGANGLTLYSRDFENIYVVDARGAERMVTAAEPPFSERDASFSNDGRQIAFVRSDRSLGTRDLWVMNADGSSRRNLTDSPGIAESARPVTWSSDDKWLFYAASVDGVSQLFRIAVDGSKREQLTHDRFPSFRPSPSPDGRRIAFIANRRGSGVERDNRIFVMDCDGTNVRQLGDLSPIHGTLSWSPSGDRIAFNALADDTVEIFTIGIEKQDVRQLTRSPQPLLDTLAREGAAAARELFAERREVGREHELFVPAAMNRAGYGYLAAGDLERAIAVFELNITLHPELANGWDSLGEAYKLAGRNAEAVECFRKSLSLDPPPRVRENSLKMLRELGASPAVER